MNQGHATSAHVAIIAILVTSVATTGTSLHVLRHVTAVMDEMPATAPHVLMLASLAPSALLGRESTSWKMQNRQAMLVQMTKTPTSKARKKATRIFDGGR